mmetsp:Transcript_16113/g.62841  ORF Transcript_16113/g.62841 Transcript_16113/m.62841 type:complete len:324 (+) Transcript_16113:653-1624(+)
MRTTSSVTRTMAAAPSAPGTWLTSTSVTTASASRRPTRSSASRCTARRRARQCPLLLCRRTSWLPISSTARSGPRTCSATSACPRGAPFEAPATWHVALLWTLSSSSALPTYSRHTQRTLRSRPSTRCPTNCSTWTLIRPPRLPLEQSAPASATRGPRQQCRSQPREAVGSSVARTITCRASMTQTSWSSLVTRARPRTSASSSSRLALPTPAPSPPSWTNASRCATPVCWTPRWPARATSHPPASASRSIPRTRRLLPSSRSPRSRSPLTGQLATPPAGTTIWSASAHPPSLAVTAGPTVPGTAQLTPWKRKTRPSRGPTAL